MAGSYRGQSSGSWQTRVTVDGANITKTFSTKRMADTEHLTDPRFEAALTLKTLF